MFYLRYYNLKVFMILLLIELYYSFLIDHVSLIKQRTLVSIVHGNLCLKPTCSDVDLSIYHLSISISIMFSETGPETMFYPLLIFVLFGSTDKRLNKSNSTLYDTNTYSNSTKLTVLTCRTWSWNQVFYHSDTWFC